LQPVRDVVLQRAVRLTKGNAALRAARGLLCRLRLNVVGIDFVKVDAAPGGVAFCGRLLLDRYETEHALLRHRFHPEGLGGVLCALNSSHKRQISTYEPYGTRNRDKAGWEERKF